MIASITVAVTATTSEGFEYSMMRWSTESRVPAPIAWLQNCGALEAGHDARFYRLDPSVFLPACIARCTVVIEQWCANVQRVGGNKSSCWVADAACSKACG